MLVTLIGADQGFSASVDEIVKRGDILAERYNFDNYQQMIDQYGAVINCDTGYQVIYAKVAEFMSGQVKQTPAGSSESTETTAETQESTEASSETAETTTAGN